MKRFLFAIALLCALTLSAYGQTNTVYAYNNSPSPAVFAGWAQITLSGDVRVYGAADPYYVENGFPMDKVLDTEVWFASISGGSPGAGNAVKVKTIHQYYDSTTNLTTLYIATPQDGTIGGSNPYIRIMQDFGGGSYNQFREFQPGTVGNGGLIINKPYIVKFGSNVIVGFVKYLNGFNTLKDATTTSSLPPLNFPTTTIPTVTVAVYGLPLSTSTLQLTLSSPGLSTLTLSGAALKFVAFPGVDGVTLVTFELPQSYRPYSGSGARTVTVKARLCGTCSYSPDAQFRVGT